MSLVYLNGQFLPLEEARISVTDRGFMFGDGVYEVIPVYKRRPLALEQHLDRLNQSLSGIRMDNPLPRDSWRSLIAELVQREPSDDQSLYIQLTRGAAPRDHAFPQDVMPTLFAMAKPLVPPPARWLQEGVLAITHPDFRWLQCHLKTTALLANVMLRQKAVDQGAAECILLRDGYLTEGAASNVLVVVDGVLLSPPGNHLLLSGITLSLVMELARQHGVPTEERPVTESVLRCAEEIMLTSSVREIIPVTRLDNQPVGSGKPGPLFSRLLSLYQGVKHT